MEDCSDSEELQWKREMPETAAEHGAVLCGFSTAECISCKKNYCLGAWPRKNPIESCHSFWVTVSSASSLVPEWGCNGLTHLESLWWYVLNACCVTYPLTESWKVLQNVSVFRSFDTQSVELGRRLVSFLFFLKPPLRHLNYDHSQPRLHGQEQLPPGLPSKGVQPSPQTGIILVAIPLNLSQD